MLHKAFQFALNMARKVKLTVGVCVELDLHVLCFKFSSVGVSEM